MTPSTPSAADLLSEYPAELLIAPPDGLSVEEAAHAIAREPLVELFDKLLVLAAVTQEHPMSRHSAMLPQRAGLLPP